MNNRINKIEYKRIQKRRNIPMFTPLSRQSKKRSWTILYDPIQKHLLRLIHIEERDSGATLPISANKCFSLKKI